MGRRIPILIALLALVVPATAGAARPHPNGPIVFSGGTPAQHTGLWAWNAGWRGLRRVTNDPTDGDPQASPDGRWVVFTRRVGTTSGGGPSSIGVFRARADGSQVVQVTSGHFDRSPSFSPSGNRILFTRAELGTGREFAARPYSAEELTPEHIYSVNLDGTGLTQLTTGDFSDRNAVFSPNGRVVAFERCALSQGCHVWTMRPDGSGARDATPRLAAWSAEPAFNPTGSRIVYVRGYPGSSTSDLFTMRPNGTAVRRLTGRSGHPLGGVSSPSWSPDGTRVVFQETGAKYARLRIVRVRDRRLGATLGGPRFAQSPDRRTPAWLRH
jgi:Tol biopolymer transport system component